MDILNSYLCNGKFIIIQENNLNKLFMLQRQNGNTQHTLVVTFLSEKEVTT